MVILLNRRISSHTINIQTNTVRLHLISTISLTLRRPKAMAMTMTMIKVRLSEGTLHTHLSPAINLSMKATMLLQALHLPTRALTLHSLLRESLWVRMIPTLKIAA